MKEFEGYVCVLDILGFRESIKNESPLAVVNKIQKVIAKIGKNFFETPADFESQFIIHWNSDTIFICTPSEAPLPGLLTSVYVKNVFNALISNGYAVKGAIAYGKVINYRLHGISVLAGEPVVDAFELQESLKLIGVVVHHTAEIKIHEEKIAATKDKTLLDSYFLDFGYYKCNFDFGVTEMMVNHWLYLSSIDIEKAKEDGQNGDNYEVFRSAYDRLISLRFKCSGRPRVYYDNTFKYLEDLKTKCGINEDIV